MNGDLFERNREDWLADPAMAFDTWLQQQNYKSSSITIYRTLWAHFLEWLRTKHIALQDVDTGHMNDFLATLPAKREHRARYLRIIERAFDRIHRVQLGAPNPARGSALIIGAEWKETASNAPTQFLSIAHRKQITKHLLSPAESRTGPSAVWKDSRDRALIAVFLGAGLKLTEAINLPFRTLDVADEWIVVVSEDGQFSRRIRIRADLRPLVTQWCTVRRHLRTDSALAFPATPQGLPMHKATVLRAIDALVKGAQLSGVLPMKISPQVLRNTYAAVLFEEGQTLDFVGERLGLVRMASVERIHESWSAWQAGQAQCD